MRHMQEQWSLLSSFAILFTKIETQSVYTPSPCESDSTHDLNFYRYNHMMNCPEFNSKSG